MTVATRHADRKLVGAALHAYSEYARLFELARRFRNYGARNSARFFIREARHQLMQFEELLLAAEAGS